MWSINNHIHNATGIWGDVDANHSFCEPHYAVSRWFAEFFNSLSSLIYILVATSLHFPSDRLLKVAQVWLVAIGLGSMLFHGTMRYWMQLCDEIPMVGFSTTLWVAKMLKPHPWFEGIHLSVPVGLAILYSLGLCVCYIVFDQYEIFVHGFTLLCILDAILAYNTGDHETHGAIHRRSRYVGLCALLLGRAAWETEHFLCVSHPSVWPLHIVWHALSCLGAQQAMLTAYLVRADKDADLPQWSFPTWRSSSISDKKTEKKKVA